MLKLFKSIIYSFFQNFFQVISLLIVILIMLVILLGIFSSNDYVKNQYAKIYNNAAIYDNTISSSKDLVFRNDSKLWKNKNYFTSENKLDIEIFKKATLSISHLTEFDKEEILTMNNDVQQYLNANISTIYKVTYCDEPNKIKIGCDSSKISNKGYWFVNSQIINNDGLGTPYVSELFEKYQQYDYFHLITTNEAENLLTINQELEQLHKDNLQDNFPRNITSDTMREHIDLYWFIASSISFNRLEYVESLDITEFLTSGNAYRVKSYDATSYFNKPYIIKENGKFNLNDGSNYVFVFKRFADVNNLSLGSKFRIMGQEVIIAGYATDVNDAYFLMQSGEMPSLSSSTVVWVNKQTYNKLKGDVVDHKLGENKKSIYGFKHQKNTDLNFNFQTLKQEYNRFSLYWNLKLNNNDFAVIWNPYLMTKEALNARILIINSVATTFSLLIFGINLLIIFILIHKSVINNQQSFGMLKSLGYSTIKISLVMTIAQMIPIIFVSIGSIFLSYYMQSFFNQTYIDFFVFPEYGISFNVLIIILIIVVPLLIIAFFTFIFAFFLLRKNPLTLMSKSINYSYKTVVKSKTSNKSSFFNKIVDFSFKTKITFFFANNSFSKLSLTFVSTLAASTLLFFSLSAFKMNDSIMNKQWEGVNVNYLYNYHTSNDDLKLMYKGEGSKVDYQAISELNPNNNIVEDIKNNSAKITNQGYYDVSNKWIKSSEVKIIIEQLNNPNSDNLLGLDLETKKLLVSIINTYPYLRDYFTGTNLKNDIIILFNNIFYCPEQDKMINIFNEQIYSFNMNKYQRIKNSNQKISKIDEITIKTNINQLNVINETHQEFIKPSLNNKTLQEFFDFDIENIKIKYEHFLSSLQNNFGYDKITILPLLVNANDVWASNLKQDDFVYLSDGDFNFINDDNKKPLFGYIFDTFDNLTKDTVITREKEFYEYTNLNVTYFNTKLSQNTANDFQSYFSIVSNKKNYQISFNKNELFKTDYWNDDLGWSSAIEGFTNIHHKKQLTLKFSTYLESLIICFIIGAIVIVLIIVFVTSNITINDNLRFVTILNVIGYHYKWLASRFILIFMPIMLITWIISIPLARPIIKLLTDIIYSETKVLFPVYIADWYYPLVLLILVILFTVSFSICWLSLIYRNKIRSITNT